MSAGDLRNQNSRKRILVLGMLDSVHFARWLKQFKEQDIDFFIFASKKYRRANPMLITLLSEVHTAKYMFATYRTFNLLSGYLDFFTFELARKFFSIDLRSKILNRILKKGKFDFVHALEMQGAGYLVSSVNRELYATTKVIITNWGSDIYFFKNEPSHKSLIERTLSYADFYSAECVRDYKLARDLGFIGVDLPCIPNAGGFDVNGMLFDFPIPSKRNQIFIKGYGNTFGRAEIVVKLMPYLVKKFPQFHFHFYSVTEDIQMLLNELPKEIVSKVRITTTRNKLSHYEMISEFGKSRIYIGCSESDGISTSFLESLLTGCYPIQSDTSCANEWVDRGAVASIVPLDAAVLLSEIERAIVSDDLVDQAAVMNSKVSNDYLGFKIIQEQALKFYA